MLNIISDTVRFPDSLEGGRTINKVFNTYSYITSEASIAIQGFDYGFSNEDGMFFR